MEGTTVGRDRPADNWRPRPCRRAVVQQKRRYQPARKSPFRPCGPCRRRPFAALAAAPSLRL